MMTTKTIAFISDIHIGPWVVPQKVQTSFIIKEGKRNKYFFHLFIPNCMSILFFQIYSLVQ